MRITKAIYLSFNNTNLATSQVTVPFIVSSIHIKSIGFDAGTIPASGTATYGIISSDLTDNQPLGIFYNDSTYSLNSYQNVVCDLYTPRSINGTYNFYLLKVDGTPYIPTSGGTDKLCLILEFNREIDYE